MYLCTTFRIYPTKIQDAILCNLIDNFSIEINKVIDCYIRNKQVVDVRFNEISNSIPWDSKIEVLKIAKTDFVKMMESNKEEAKIRYNFCKLTNHNFKYFEDQKLLIQTFQKEVMLIDVFCNDFTKNIINSNKLTSLRIYKKKNKWIGTFTYDYLPELNHFENIMGIDLGIKVPAVAVTSTGKIRFFGNGRQKRYIHTQQKKYHRNVSLQRTSTDKKNTVNWSNKLRDIDHKISKNIIEFAKSENVKTIKLENLVKLQSRNSKIESVNTWSYHRLLTFIMYKAEKEGMHVQLINPKNTSKKCPKCSKINNLVGRRYLCNCGYSNHRDIVGAINILNTQL